MKHERTTRILHFGIAASVLFQMFGEKLIGLPAPDHPKRVIDALLIGLHEGIGSIALILVCVYLLVVVDEASGRERLFPWLHAAGRNSLWLEMCRDMPGWLHGKIPPPDESHAVAGTIHGLGVALALFLGLTGSMLFIGIGPHGNMTPDIKVVWQIHRTLDTMMWIFVVGHAGMALAHEFRGHKMLLEMFSLGKDPG